MDHEGLFELLLESDQKDYLMTCSIDDHGADNLVYSNMGLVAKHAYSLIAIQHIDGHKLLNIRNPWGSFEWNGDWSDNSELWSPELKQLVGFTDADDGSFWMNFADF